MNGFGHRTLALHAEMPTRIIQLPMPDSADLVQHLVFVMGIMSI
jgi:hypothetical protein